MSAFKNTAPIVWLLISIAVFAGGMIMLLDVKLAWNMIITSISIMLVVVGIMYLSAIFLKKGESKFKELGIGILSLLGGVFTYLNPQYLKVPFSFAIGMLGIIIGCFVLLSSIKLKKTALPGCGPCWWLWSISAWVSTWLF
jgi:hypothetical protein